MVEERSGCTQSMASAAARWRTEHVVGHGTDTRMWWSACSEVAKAQFSEVEDVERMARTLAVMQTLSSEECRHPNRHLHVQALGVPSLKPHWLK